MEAVETGQRTCIGLLSHRFPMSHGNCFDVVDAKGKSYRVLNFNAENLDELEKRGVVTWPIKFIPVLHCAFIHDTRIEDAWYSRDLCHTCTPLWLSSPLTRLREQRGVEAGRIVIKNGMITEKVVTKNTELKARWSVANDESFVSVPDNVNTVDESSDAKTWRPVAARLMDIQHFVATSALVFHIKKPVGLQYVLSGNDAFRVRNVEHSNHGIECPNHLVVHVSPQPKCVVGSVLTLKYGD